AHDWSLTLWHSYTRTSRITNGGGRFGATRSSVNTMCPLRTGRAFAIDGSPRRSHAHQPGTIRICIGRSPMVT
ncbi:MAG TPA: hypothetical protein VK595_07305, partial [Vicinamibacterales bacterium]|nr:hypothetical protein [Vicinamibacterales bacterium]